MSEFNGDVSSDEGICVSSDEGIYVSSDEGIYVSSHADKESFRQRSDELSRLCDSFRQSHGESKAKLESAVKQKEEMISTLERQLSDERIALEVTQQKVLHSSLLLHLSLLYSSNAVNGHFLVITVESCHLKGNCSNIE